jgi:hypothetical protein
MAVPVIMHGSEAWVLTEAEYSKIKTEDMK